MTLINLLSEVLGGDTLSTIIATSTRSQAIALLHMRSIFVASTQDKEIERRGWPRE